MLDAKPKVFVEVVVKTRACVLCDFAVAVLEETSEEMEPGVLGWEIVEAAKPQGGQRVQELTVRLGKIPAMPSIFINEEYVFDTIPGMEEINQAIMERVGS
jgi:hypothetical protein